MHPWLAVLALACASCGRVSFELFAASADGASGDAVADGSSNDGVLAASSVQRGIAVMDTTVKNIFVNPVDPMRTLVLCDFRTTGSNAARQPMCELVDATTVRVTFGVADTSALVQVQVVELPAGAIVQRGTRDMALGLLSDQVTLATVDLAHSFATFSRWTDADTPSADPAVTPIARIVAGTTLQFDRVSAGGVLHIAWQVVTWPTATVQSGTATLTDGLNGTSIGSGIGTVSNAFIIASAEASTSTERDYYVRANLGTNRTFTRIGAIGAIDVAWFTVETPALRVQRGNTFMGTQPVANASIVAPTDLSRTFVLLSVEGGRVGQEMDVDSVRCTADIAGSQLSITRNTSVAVDTSTNVGWQIVEM